MDVGDWTYIDLWKFIRKSPLQLLGKDILADQLFEKSGVEQVMLTRHIFASLSTRWPYRLVCINPWRVCKCCVASSLPGNVVVESILKWD